MKLIAAITLFACIALLSAKPSAENEAMFKQLLTACMAKESATDADVATMLAHEPPTTQTGRCLSACIMETVGVIQEGKFSAAGSIALTDKATGGDATKSANAKAIADDCASVAADDRCDLAMAIMECSNKAAVARGLDPKHIVN